MTLQYLEALKAIGASPSTKFVIPAELNRLLESTGRYVERGMANLPVGGSASGGSAGGASGAGGPGGSGGGTQSTGS
jgi:hypothetical protein